MQGWRRADLKLEVSSGGIKADVGEKGERSAYPEAESS